MQCSDVLHEKIARLKISKNVVCNFRQVYGCFGDMSVSAHGSNIPTHGWKQIDKQRKDLCCYCLVTEGNSTGRH